MDPRTRCPICRKDALSVDDLYEGRLGQSNQEYVACDLFRCRTTGCEQTIVWGQGQGPTRPWPVNQAGIRDTSGIAPRQFKKAS